MTGTRPTHGLNRTEGANVARSASAAWRWSALALGALLGVGLLKFGNPVILDHLIEPPEDWVMALFQPWPVVWGYGLLVVVALLTLGVARPQKSLSLFFLVVPLVWLGWQWLSGASSVEPALTRPVLRHFSAAVGCYYLGALCFARTDPFRWWVLPVIGAFLLMIWSGFEQHFGGLDATEKMIRETPNWEQVFPPEYLERVAKKRIFATLVYPNAFAGAILIFLPVVLLGVWRWTSFLSLPSQLVVAGSVVVPALACLVWSGSKSGWLIAVVQGLAVLAWVPMAWPRRWRWGLMLALVGLGLALFFVRYRAYFARGAPSVGARFQYWSAAWTTALERPIFGTGPGTFARAYARIKPPEAEMARLVHNDFLEQASDSGWIGFTAYAALWLGGLGWMGWQLGIQFDSVLFVRWLGLLAWALQSCVEFGLYLPALAWSAFFLLGWALADANSAGRCERREAG